jgi:hypothetical protein
MKKPPANIKEVRESLAEIAYTAWVDKSKLPQAIVAVNALGKMNATIASELKNAELAKEKPNIPFLQY